MKKFQKNKGITLIALIVTIIILLILSGTTIKLISGSAGLMSRAERAEFTNRIAKYKEEVELYNAEKAMDELRFNTENTYAGYLLKNAIDAQIEEFADIDISIVKNLEEIIEDIKENDKNYLVVYKGKLYYVANENITKEEQEICEKLGVPRLEIGTSDSDEVNGVPTEDPAKYINEKTGEYKYVNGLFLCTPTLKTATLGNGFVPEKTRYMEVSDSGNLVPGNWITHNATEDWYDYKNQKWANIYVEDNGIDVYYVWIPRYCYKIVSGERTDVKFIDLENNYRDSEGNETKWEELAEEGYQVPQAFAFADTAIPGYWAMKYTVGDSVSPTIVNYDMSVAYGKVTLKNISINTSETIVKATVALNGEIVPETIDVSSLTSQTIVFDGIRKGDNTINMTLLNANGEIIGSMTKEYATAEVNEPDLTGFDANTTFYVTYDENGTEYSTVPINKEEPDNWYEYGSSMWANIVTRNNEMEVYYTWIPRYEYKLDTANQRSVVKFIKVTQTEADEGYQIPEAFTFNGEPISGYWTTKYTLGDASAPLFATEITATNCSIRTKGITGTSVASSGQIYNYYIDGEFKGKTTNSSDNFVYTDLEANKEYTILVEIRNSSTNAYLGSVVKQVKTVDANEPELVGFNADMTYYVTYDASGNTIVGDKIENDGSNMPNAWYDYSTSNWANIVVTDGTVSNGTISGATVTTYYVWIPRYEYKITASQKAQTASARTDVRFLSGNSTEVDEGYQIPEAFKFNKEQLTGYWAMKYTVGE